MAERVRGNFKLSSTNDASGKFRVKSLIWRKSRAWELKFRVREIYLASLHREKRTGKPNATRWRIKIKTKGKYEEEQKNKKRKNIKAG